MNERRMEAFGGFLQVVQGLAIIYSIVIIVLWFINGGVWFQDNIFPLHAVFFVFFLGLTFLVLIPLMVIKTTRPYSALSLLVLTYLFGGIVWFYSAHYCLYAIGVVWTIIGFLCAGIGVVPIAFIGAMIKGHWNVVALMVVVLIATFGCRALAAYAVSISEE
jgi:hypothetical protein